jgi:hypothetical protein
MFLLPARCGHAGRTPLSGMAAVRYKKNVLVSMHDSLKPDYSRTRWYEKLPIAVDFLSWTQLLKRDTNIKKSITRQFFIPLVVVRFFLSFEYG